LDLVESNLHTLYCRIYGADVIAGSISTENAPSSRGILWYRNGEARALVSAGAEVALAVRDMKRALAWLRTLLQRQGT